MANAELKVKEYFQQAVDYVFERLNDTGYKRLKSGEIKKKEGDLTYEITWGNSRYNYIDHENQSCSLRIIGLHATIVHKIDDWLYRFSFCSSPNSYISDFQLFKNFLELDFDILDKIIEDINEIFIPATKLLKENPQTLMQQLDYEPETFAYDYHYRIFLSDAFFERYGTAEDKQKFLQRKTHHQSFEGRAKRDCEAVLYLCLHHHNSYDMTQADKYSPENLLKILPIVLENIKKDEHYEYFEKMCQYIENRQSTHPELFILTAYFTSMSRTGSKVYQDIQKTLGIDFKYQK